MQFKTALLVFGLLSGLGATAPHGNHGDQIERRQAPVGNPYGGGSSGFGAGAYRNGGQYGAGGDRNGAQYGAGRDRNGAQYGAGADRNGAQYGAGRDRAGEEFGAGNYRNGPMSQDNRGDGSAASRPKGHKDSAGGIGDKVHSGPKKSSGGARSGKKTPLLDKKLKKLRD